MKQVVVLHVWKDDCFTFKRDEIDKARALVKELGRDKWYIRIRDTEKEEAE